MAESLRNIFFQFMIVGLFIISVITFVGQFQLENNSLQSIYDNDIINSSLSSLVGNNNNVSDSINTSKNTYDAEIPERGFGSLLIFSIVTAGQTIVTGIVSTYNVMIVLPASVLGIPQIVISTITGILLVTLILLSWRVIRLGS